MPTYPNNVASFSTKVDNQDAILASHPNLIQEEVVAIEQTIGTSRTISVLSNSKIAGSSSYVAAPTNNQFNTVKDRVSNVERGLMGVGYVPYSDAGATLNITAAGSTQTGTFNSIPGGYRKLVLELEVTAYTSGGAIGVTLNGVTSNYSVARVVYGASTEGDEVQIASSFVNPSTAVTSFQLGTSPANGVVYVFEVPNYATTRSYKVVRSLGPSVSLTGSVPAGGAVTSLTVSVAGTQTVQATLYVVK